MTQNQFAQSMTNNRVPRAFRFGTSLRMPFHSLCLWSFKIFVCRLGVGRVLLTKPGTDGMFRE